MLPSRVLWPSSRAGRGSLPWSTTHPDSVAEAGGGAAKHTRAWSVGARAVVAGCRRLRFRGPTSTAPQSVSRPDCGDQPWAVSGPSEDAQQWPTMTNDHHQAHEPTVPDQQKPSSPRSPVRPRARRNRLRASRQSRDRPGCHRSPRGNEQRQRPIRQGSSGSTCTGRTPRRPNLLRRLCLPLKMRCRMVGRVPSELRRWMAVPRHGLTRRAVVVHTAWMQAVVRGAYGA